MREAAPRWMAPETAQRPPSSLRAREPQRVLCGRRGEAFRDLSSRGPRIGHAIGDTDAAKTAAGDIQPRPGGQRAVDGRHAIEVSDVVLGAGPVEAINTRQQWRSGESE